MADREIDAVLRFVPVSSEEAARHRETAAVAMRTALTEATILLDARVKAIEKANPGRRKGSVSTFGAELADAVKCCADMLWAMHGSIHVPERVRGDPYVPMDVIGWQGLEVQVERLIPGTYPHHAERAAASPDPARPGTDGERP